jgi:hypothetical protein
VAASLNSAIFKPRVVGLGRLFMQHSTNEKGQGLNKVWLACNPKKSRIGGVGPVSCSSTTQG